MTDLVEVRQIARALKTDEIRAVHHAACTGGILAKDSLIVLRCKRYMRKLVKAGLLTEDPESYVITLLGSRVSFHWSEVHGG